MRVLLLNCPNRLSRRPEFFPYGLGILSNVLKNLNIEVMVYDLNLNRNLNKFFGFLNQDKRWDIIGISGLITTYQYQKELANHIREAIPNALIISGGGLASAVPELLVSRTAIDVACIGEGEIILSELVIGWEKDKNIANVKGIVWKDHGTLIRNPITNPIQDLDSLPFPNWEIASLPEYFQYSGFSHKGIGASRLSRRCDLTTTRGCPYNCSFCFNVFNRQNIRIRSIDNVMEEMIMLKNLYEIDSIDFLDENFCFSKNRVVEICNRIIAEKLNIKWGTAARVDNVDKDLLKLMKEAGCIFILYGFETGSQQILNRMDKRISIERSWETFKITEEVGIDARGNLIIGHPGENTETLYESLEFQKRRHKFLIDKYSNCLADAEYQEEIEKRFSTVSFCTPYPGTRIYENYKEKIGDLEMFLKRITLHDAKELIINLTELPLVELLGYQSLLSNPSLWDYFQNTKS